MQARSCFVFRPDKAGRGSADIHPRLPNCRRREKFIRLRFTNSKQIPFVAAEVVSIWCLSVTELDGSICLCDVEEVEHTTTAFFGADYGCKDAALGAIVRALDAGGVGRPHDEEMAYLIFFALFCVGGPAPWLEAHFPQYARWLRTVGATEAPAALPASV